jgi:hypothetical protein
VLRETIDAVFKSNKNAAETPRASAERSAKPAPTSSPANRPPRVTMGSAGGNGSLGHSRVTVSGQTKGNR